MNDKTLKTQIRKARGKFVAMAGTYCLGVFNDNFFKQAACLLAIFTGRKEMQGMAVMIFTLPWLLFAAPAGWFANRPGVSGAKAVELAAMSCGGSGIITVNWVLIMIMMFLMALQSTIFSPALNGSIPELYPSSYVIRANSTLKMLVTSGNLVGIILAGVALKYKSPVWFGVEMGRMIVGLGVIAIAAIGFLISFGVVHRPAADPKVRFPRCGPINTVRELWNFRHDRLLAIIVSADAFVWFIAVLQILVINDMGKTLFGLDEQQTSYMLAPELLGVAIGGLLAGFLARGERWHRLLTPGMFGLALFTAVIVLVPWLPEAMRMAWVVTALFFAGMAGGILLIPMESFFQIRPASEEKGAVIAATNFAGFFGIMLAGLADLVLQKLLDPANRFAVIGGLTLLAAIWLGRALRKQEANG